MEAPNTKHQAPEKLQASSSNPGYLRALVFGAFLELGVWCLMFPGPVVLWSRGLGVADKAKRLIVISTGYE
jgi:hypothetical protein